MNFDTAQSRESLALALKAKIIALHPDSAVAYIKIPHLDFNYLFFPFERGILSVLFQSSILKTCSK